MAFTFWTGKKATKPFGGIEFACRGAGLVGLENGLYDIEE